MTQEEKNVTLRILSRQMVGSLQAARLLAMDPAFSEDHRAVYHRIVTALSHANTIFSEHPEATYFTND